MDLIIFIVVLSIIVFAHEGGHFLVAKKAGIRVLEFGFGLPPRIFGKKIGETIYSINLLPIGGFVRLFGEEQEDVREFGLKRGSSEVKKTAFFAKSKKVRVAVVVAGVVMNFLLGVVLFSVIYTAIGIPKPDPSIVMIAGISKDSPASKVFELGDEVVAVDNKPVDSAERFQSLVKERSGKEASFEVVRKNEQVSFQAIPRLEPPVESGPSVLTFGKGGVSCQSTSRQEGPLGVLIVPKTEMVRFPLWQMPFRGAIVGIDQALGWGLTIVSGLGQIFSQMACGSVPEGVGGPVEIGFIVAEVSREGLVPLMQLVGVLSINLAILNLLPIPALDGGRLLFIGVEAVTGRRVNAKLERLMHTIGFALLLTLMLVITIQDVMRRFSGESIKALIERIVNL